MGHTLQAIIGQLPAMTDLQIRFEMAVLVALDQGLFLAPVTEDLSDAIALAAGIEEGRRRIRGFDHLHAALDALLAEMSQSASVAYIETDYFGGTGSQAAAAYVRGVRSLTQGESDEIAGVIATTGPINEALAAIGVRRRRRKDEFTTLGLPRYRDASHWEDEHDDS